MNFDRELIVRAQAGDGVAQENLIRQFSPLVFRLISRYFRHREDVEDLAQDVFLKVFARIDQVRPDDNFPGWLARVAVNACYDELRKTRRRKVAFETFGPSKLFEPVGMTKEPEVWWLARRAVESGERNLRIARK